MDEIERMEAALRAAVAAHRISLQRRIETEARGFELRFLFARLGLMPEDLDIVSASPAGDALPPALRRTLRQRLAAETARLVRLARARHPDYDLNRHIAVRRARAWVDAADVPKGETAPTAPRSGRVPNQRLPARGRGPRREIARRPVPARPAVPPGGNSPLG